MNTVASNGPDSQRKVRSASILLVDCCPMHNHSVSASCVIQTAAISILQTKEVPANTSFDWCCFYYFIRNSLVALLEALCARKQCAWSYRRLHWGELHQAQAGWRHCFAHASRSVVGLRSQRGAVSKCSQIHHGFSLPLGGDCPPESWAPGVDTYIAVWHGWLWLTSCSSSLLPSPCTAETSNLFFHPHNTLACNHPLPHTHTLLTACQRTW